MDYEKIFKALPGLYLILDTDRPNFTILSASDAYVAQTMTSKRDIIGKPVFDVFPPDPKTKSTMGMDTVIKSLVAVLNTKIPHKIDKLEYPIRDENNVYRDRLWTIENIPVLDFDGSILYIINSVHDITELQRMAKETENSTKIMSELLKLNDSYYNRLKDRQ